MSLSFLMPDPGSWADRVFTFIIANLLWLFCAVLVLPLPAATAGLFATLMPWMRGKDKEVFVVFFGTMRRLWLKSTLLLVVDVAIIALLLLNFRLMNLMDQDNILLWFARSAQIFVLLAVLMTNVYLWPLLVLFDLPLRRLVSVSVRLGLVHPFWTLLVIGLAVLPILSGLIVPGVIIILGGGSAIAFIVNWGAWRIIKLHATPEELAELDELDRE